MSESLIKMLQSRKERQEKELARTNSELEGAIALRDHLKGGQTSIPGTSRPGSGK